MIKAIAFDVGGVLQLTRYLKKPKKGHRELGVHEEISKHLGITTDNWFDAIDTTYAGSITGKIPRKKALKTIAKNLEIPVKKLLKIVISVYKKEFKRNNELYNLAIKLRKSGYKIAILSDQWYLSDNALIPKKDRKLFNLSIISCEVGMRKPSKEIYKLLIRRLKLAPHEILFIDNRDWNTIPAEKLGLKTILFKNNKQLKRELRRIKIIK